MSTPRVTERDVETYERDGVVCLRGVFDQHWIDLLGEGVEKDIRAPGPLHTLQQTGADPGFFLTDFCMAQRIPEFREFLVDSPAAEIAARIMRSQRINFFYDAIWVKEQGTLDCEYFPRVWPRAGGEHPARSARFTDPAFRISI